MSAKKFGRSLGEVSVVECLLNHINEYGGTLAHNDLRLTVPLSSKLSVTCIAQDWFCKDRLTLRYTNGLEAPVSLKK